MKSSTNHRETTQRGSVMQGMFPYPVFSREVRKYLDQTARRGSPKCYSHPKTKSSFQNLKFPGISGQFTIMNNASAFLYSPGPPATLAGHLGSPQNVRNNSVWSDPVELRFGA